MVIPIFYNVDPSEVRKQTGEFGKVFNKTCKGKTKDQKQSWKQALEDVANMAGEHIHNMCNEADMIEKIANYVFNKLTPPSDDFGDFVGIEAHLEAMIPMLCLESEEAIMVGIVGPSGIGKTIIARALFSQLSSQFHHRAFISYKSNVDMKLYWEQQLLSEILGQKDLRICDLGMVKQKLKHMKVLIVLDDVNNLELLKTLAGQTGWFGPGSRIIVITQDRWLLKAHNIDLIYEVKFPSEDLALKMLCRSAFGQNSPPGGFMEVVVEVAKLAGNLPFGLTVMGLSLIKMGKDQWIERLPRLRNDLDGDIVKKLRDNYDRLDRHEQDLFRYLAYNGEQVSYIRYFHGDSVDIELKKLTEKSLIRITPFKDVDMHYFQQKLARDIDREESIGNPGKRRYLDDIEDIRNVFTSKIGTETVQGIYLNTSDINQPVYMHQKAFKGMINLQYLVVSGEDSEGRLHLLQGLTYLPPKLKSLKWYECPLKCLPSNFKAEFLVELVMIGSKLEKLWEGTQPLGMLKRVNMNYSRYLKEIPDLSNATNLEVLYLVECTSLVTLPSSIQNATKLRKLNMENCTKLESLPTQFNLESLEFLNLTGCFRLRNFPQINLTRICGNEIEVDDCLWNKNLDRCIPSKFLLEHLVQLTLIGNMVEKLWEGVQSLGSLVKMNLSDCGNLIEFPDLSKATNLEVLKLNNCKSLVTVPSTIGSLVKMNLSDCGNLIEFSDLSKATNLKVLKLNNCKSLVTVPSTIGNLNQLIWLEMKGCTGLEVLPTDVNLSSLEILDLSGCKRLRSFPQISWNIMDLNLNDTAIEEVPCCIENFSMLIRLSMRGCKRLKNISPNIFRLTDLDIADFSECVEVGTALGDVTVVETTEDHSSLSETIFHDDLRKICLFCYHTYSFKFNNCFNLDGDARELILRSSLRPTFLPGGNVPKYFTHRSSKNSLTVTLPQSSLSQEFLAFKACVVLEPITYPNHYAPYLRIRLNFRDHWENKYVDLGMIYNTDHLVLIPFKFRNIAPLSILELNIASSSILDCNVDYNAVEFDFSVVNNDEEPLPLQRIKGCGIRVLDLSPSPASSDGTKMPMLWQ